MLLVTEEALPQTLALRQEHHVITQILTRDHSTITTIVTLGTMPTDTPDEGTSPEADIYGNDNGLSSAELGAILGSVAVVILIVIVGLFCFANARRRRTRVVRYGSSYTSDSDVTISPPPRPRMPRRPPPVVERIPGGPRYPTYRALPIRNPRNPPPVRHVA